MLNFDSLENGLGLVLPLHFVYDFSRKNYFMLYSICYPVAFLSRRFLVWPKKSAQKFKYV